MVRKKIDNRIRVMIENGINLGHRSLFVVVGDKAKDQVVILHEMLSKAVVKARPSVLWCYKKELGFSSHRKKKMKSLQKKIKHGKLDINEDDPFELFVASTSIRYCYYKETHKILGNTFGMAVLQDFEALTPNLLARTIETVEGGGLIVLLLKSVTSLKQLYAMTMDIHARYRTEAHAHVTGRFNERFILSLANNKRCVVMDDGLNILPLSSHIKHVTEVPPKSSEDGLSPEEEELRNVREKFQDSQPTGSLLNLCKTIDQAKALLEFIDAITDKKLDRTVSLTAGRGRGKSAALGLAMAAAIGFGYSNIFVTSPSPENLQTLFDFVFKGFDAMEYEEHTDYDIIQSTNPEFHNAVVRVNVHDERSDNSHRQTIQYLHPSDAHKLGQAELLVIDEAAAIPLPLVKSLLGPYLVFMASTINGYEGTGRSLSLKLLDQLRQQSNSGSKSKAPKDSESKVAVTSRTLREVSLDESIRYRPHDEVERWLNQLLCLDASIVPIISSGTPSREDCNLYYVNRDTLFCYHRASEAFLQRIMALFVASHYKNTPDDLQLLSDAPAHHIFCLLGPTHPDMQSLPEVLCVIQVCLEGEISRKSVQEGLRLGNAPSGDMIPWNVARQFQDDNFPSLSGARIVRIATHPNYQSMGYGSRAIELLQQYYEMKIPSLDEDPSGNNQAIEAIVDDDEVSLLEETIKPRKNLPPLLLKLTERRPEKLDYLGVSYGLTPPLLKFWTRKGGFTPVYIGQVANNLTGEHTCIMIKPLDHEDEAEECSWLKAFYSDFRRRLANLLGFDFRSFSASDLGLHLLSNKGQKPLKEALSLPEVGKMITAYDLGRLKSFTNNMVEYRLILDLVPTLAKMFFLYEAAGLDGLHLSAIQKSILIGMGLQFKSVDTLATELGLDGKQLLGKFRDMMRQIVATIEKKKSEAIKSSIMSHEKVSEFRPLAPLSEEMNEAAKEQKEAFLSGDLSQYKVKGSEDVWSAALSKNKGKLNLISVKTGEKRASSEVEENKLAASEKKKAKKMKKSKKKQ